MLAILHMNMMSWCLQLFRIDQGKAEQSPQVKALGNRFLHKRNKQSPKYFARSWNLYPPFPERKRPRTNGTYWQRTLTTEQQTRTQCRLAGERTAVRERKDQPMHTRDLQEGGTHTDPHQRYGRSLRSGHRKRFGR